MIFKLFLRRGNVLDLAVAVIIGAAFGKIVSSLVDDMLMPFLSWMTGGLDLSRWSIVLGGGGRSLDEAEAAGLPILWPGRFLNAVVQFLLIAFVLFLFIRYWAFLQAQAARLAEEKRALHQAENADKTEKREGAEAREEVVEAVAQTEKRCPYCRESIHPEAVRCPHCTSELADATAPLPPLT